MEWAGLIGALAVAAGLLLWQGQRIKAALKRRNGARKPERKPPSSAKVLADIPAKVARRWGLER